jgi:HlyD family secretion protein
MFKKIKFPSRKVTIITGVIALLVIAGGIGYYYISKNNQKSTRPSMVATYNTSAVRQGDLAVTAPGTGTVVTNREAKLSFSIDGTVDSVNVQVGEKVKEGQVLAKLQNLSTLDAELTSANLALVTAEQALQELKDNAPATLGNSQLAVSTDKKNLSDAQAGLIKKGQVRCDTKTTASYYDNYLRLQNKFTELNDGSVSGNYYLTVIVPARDAAMKAFSAYKYCTEFKDYEVDSSEANLNLAKAQIQVDQTKLDTLQKNNGIDPVDMATAENKLAVAQAAYDVAKTNLENATLTAPFDGTILTVAGMAGDRITSDTVFITIADDVHPQVEFVVDESDLLNVALDEYAEVKFDAFEGQTFKGTVTQVNPTLVATSGYSTVQGIISLDLTDVPNPPTFFQGLTASVTLYKGKVTNGLLIPLAALRDIGDGKYGVFTLENDHTLKLNMVTVGLKSTTSAEILSGLEKGQTVSTGISGSN